MVPAGRGPPLAPVGATHRIGGRVTKILLVDDLQLSLELERSVLQRADCEVLLATRGDEALSLAREHRPQLIVLDARMPGMDGLEVCRQLKADPDLSGIPVVLAALPLDFPACETAGGDGVVAKPVTRARLLETLRRFVPIQERDELRVPITVKVDWVGAEREGSAFARDLSAGGMFLRMREPLELGTELEIGFHLPATPGIDVRARARVVHVVRAGTASAQRGGVGIAFQDLPPSLHLELSRFVRDRSSEATI
jgi:CheY-like chemotaxis protein/Tfp pilus assembly protein PilZ